MKPLNVLKSVFALLAAVLVLFSVFACIHAMNAPATLLTAAPAAEALTERFMETAQTGTLSDLAPMLWGQPALSGEDSNAMPLAGLIWNHFRSSMTYEFQGDCYAADSGLCRDVAVTALDIRALTALVEAELPGELAARVAAAEDPSRVYEQGSVYREDFVLDALEAVCRDVLSRQDCLSTRVITLELYPKDGTWWILPTEELLSVLTGQGG